MKVLNTNFIMSLLMNRFLGWVVLLSAFCTAYFLEGLWAAGGTALCSWAVLCILALYFQLPKIWRFRHEMLLILANKLEGHLPFDGPIEGLDETLSPTDILQRKNVIDVSVRIQDCGSVDMGSLIGVNIDVVMVPSNQRMAIPLALTVRYAVEMLPSVVLSKPGVSFSLWSAFGITGTYEVGTGRKGKPVWKQGKCPPSARGNQR